MAEPAVVVPAVQPLPQSFLDAIAENVGRVVTLIFPDPFRWGDAVARWEGKVLAPAEHDGYLTAGGGWSFSGVAPSYRLQFLPKGKRKPRRWRIDELVTLEVAGQVVADRRAEWFRRMAGEKEVAHG